MASTGLGRIFKGGIDEKGLKRRQAAAKASGDRLSLKKGATQKVQFGAPPDNAKFWMEYKQHVFRDGNNWRFVPCKNAVPTRDGWAEEDNGCILHDDERDEVVRTSDGFAVCVWSINDRAFKILTGSGTLLARILYQYHRNEERFTHRTWEITRLNVEGQAQFDVSQGEERAIRLGDKQSIDLNKWLAGEISRYENTVTSSRPKRSSLEDYENEDDEEEDDDEGEDEEPTEDELMDKEEWPLSELKKYAKEHGVRVSEENARNRSAIVRAIIRKRDR